MNKVYLVTFGCGKFEKSKWVLYNEAKETGWFDDIFAYGESDVTKYGRSLMGRGAGYWWWKPIVISFALNKIENDSILLYLDAGCRLNKNGYDRFNEYVGLCNQSPGFLGFGGKDFSLISSDRTHTKRDLIKLLDCDHKIYLDSNQIGGGIFFIKKNSFSLKLIDDFINLCKIDHAINDEQSFHKEYPEFIEHRHDQSVLSLLVKLRLPELNRWLLDLCELSAETYVDPEMRFPIKSRRIDDSLITN